MSYRKLGCDSAHRKAMLRALTTQLIMNERIETTETRGKEIRKTVEKMITLGKKGDLAARRNAAKFIQPVAVATEEGKSQLALKKLFEEVAPKYADRNGGYTRILRVGPRKGDGAETAIIELV